jgi:hypothetical protein
MRKNQRILYTEIIAVSFKNGTEHSNNTVVTVKVKYHPRPGCEDTEGSSCIDVLFL